ncbi:hypothetical protein NHP190012_15640 [Helicobacter sp. NHP19-012]|uniref:Uncharacterized protein n=1 Tax=Helicobacter gastrofelis TaxID=2849642 RepID=A0ABM7SPA6_9HELI|nr:hypothetical protein [Helicobacter sp. NHP19-012]BCZ19922.1 hypothetical protein NHP190012_15640 [Helicobacter sp. NHP19-012]
MPYPMLESLLENPLQAKNLKPRDILIKPNTLLYGGVKAGKSSLALLNAANYKRPMFVDCTDERLNLAELFKALPLFCQDKSVDLLILKHPTPPCPLKHPHNFNPKHAPNPPKALKPKPFCL